MTHLTFIGACIGMLITGDPPYEWHINYHDAVRDVVETTAPKFCELRASHRFTYSTCSDGLCSLESGEMCSSTIPGDVNCDGAVGAADFLLVRENWGRTSP